MHEYLLGPGTNKQKCVQVSLNNLEILEVVQRQYNEIELKRNATFDWCLFSNQNFESEQCKLTC